MDPSRRVAQYVHDQWGKGKGFLGGSVYAIGRSDDGYLWIGTERGLVRFDGSSFNLLQQPVPDAPPIGRVRGLIPDTDGNLWIRLESPRMLLYHAGKFEDPYTRFDLGEVTITATAVDSQYRMIFAGLGDRTLRYSDKHFETVLNADESPGTVISLAATPDGSIWFGTRENGLFRLSQGHLSRAAQELRNEKINCLASTKNGELWIGTDHGMHLLEVGATKLFTPPSVSDLQIIAMRIDHDGNLWVGTSRGLVRVTSSGTVSLDLVDRKLDHEVRAIYEDRDGDIWFGGPQGIERLHNGIATWFSTADGIPPGEGGPVYVDSDNRIWFGMKSGGLFLMEDGHARRISVAGLDHDVVYSISGGGDQICIGRESGGLTVLTENGASFSARTFSTSDGLPQNSVYSVHRSQDGTIWAGTVSAGVTKLSGGRFTNYSTANGFRLNAVNSIVEGSDGTIWVATPDGLTSYANAQWKTYARLDGLSLSSVRVIFEDSVHNLWIAAAEGLFFLSSEKITSPHNLPEILREQIYGIAEDSMGFLWLSTSDHVVRVNRERLMAGSLAESDIQSFGREDGFNGTEGVSRDNTIAVDQTGRIWLSLDLGLSMADPNLSIKSLFPVSVRIESISAGGRHLDSRGLIRIPPGVRNITLNYGSSNLSAPERVRFRYELDGSGQGWSDIVASRQVAFSNLAPGPYQFRIRASSSAGLWNGPETIVPFIVEPAFWQTWWFRILCCIALLGILWAAYVLRLRHMTTLLNLRLRERLSEREDIARDLHDTFFQAVQSLFLRLHTASRQLPESSPERQALEDLLNDSDRVMLEGRESFLDVPKKEFKEGDFADLIAGYCAEFAIAHPIEYRVQVDGPPRSLNPLVTMELTKIAREAICNAFRHSKAMAIEVELIFGKKEMQLRVRDNGQGFESTRLQGNSGPLHLGIQNMRKRAEKLGAEFRLWSRLRSGTELEVILIAQRAYQTTRRTWTFPGLRPKG